MKQLKHHFKNLSATQVLLLFVLSLYLLLTLFKALRLGHFGDGVVYNSIARNMAEGWGSFWTPYFSDAIFPLFYEHPPLVMYLKSLLFTLFGDSVYFEGIYGIFIGLILLWVSALLWRLSSISIDNKAGVWWVLLLLIALPYFTYAVDTGLLVVTFSVFFLLSIYYCHRAMFIAEYSNLSGLTAGILIYIGLLSVGPVALATLSLPFIVWLVFKPAFSRVVKITLIMLLSVIILLALTIWLFPESQNFWRSFLINQSLASITGERTHSPTYTKLPGHFLQEIIVPMTIMVVIMVAQRYFKCLNKSRYGVYFLLLFIASTLPFFTSSRQSYHYIFHAWFFIALALAHFSQPLARHTQNALIRKPWLKTTYLLLAVIITITAFYAMFERKDHLSRRKDFYADFYLQNIDIPPRTQVNLCPYKQMISSGERSKRIFPTLQRVYKASIVTTPAAPFLIIAKDSDCTIPDDYQLVHSQTTRQYLLYKKIIPN